MKKPGIVATDSTKTCELWLGRVLIKRFDRRALTQIVILESFQLEGWPSRIDDPLPFRSGRNAKRHLRKVLFRLNHSQTNPRIEFFSDGTGIRWELMARRKVAP